MKMNYGIYNNVTKGYFSGWLPNNAPKWENDVNKAVPFGDLLLAETQALLFSSIYGGSVLVKQTI